jgi:hypothetical protein
MKLSHDDDSFFNRRKRPILLITLQWDGKPQKITVGNAFLPFVLVESDFASESEVLG